MMWWEWCISDAGDQWKDGTRKHKFKRSGEKGGNVEGRTRQDDLLHRERGREEGEKGAGMELNLFKYRRKEEETKVRRS